MRIVSLLPSATEIVCDLGLGGQLVGVSHECDYPNYVAALPKVTRSVIPKEAPSAEVDRLVRDYLKNHKALYLLDLERLERLRPDLIVTQALCDVCAVSAEDVEAAVTALPGPPTVVNLEPSTLEEVFDAMRLIGCAASITQAAEARAGELKARIAEIAARSRGLERPRVVVLEWIDPPFSAGHWIPELVELAGGLDCVGEAGKPSRRLRWEEIKAAAPEVLFIACCGYTAERARAGREGPATRCERRRDRLRRGPGENRGAHGRALRAVGHGRASGARRFARRSKPSKIPMAAKWSRGCWRRSSDAAGPWSRRSTKRS